ncbi:YbaB/EbfC family nucleoid-associated protein [Nonomuraea gerenzanensis]|nr:YbaB/EbfC family nucleoid-associated protein [Nonomuraea gerenzanensis]UBU11531.1 YbaB/EbfC family nucleoid-associated protein [Nonomuraea gerenzanensis]
MPPRSADQEELLAYMKRAQTAVRKLQQAQERIGAVIGEGASADELVRATCDGRGVFSQVWLDPRVMRQDLETLGTTVTAALQSAQQDAERQSTAISRQALDGMDPLPEPPDARVIRDHIDQVARDILEA